MGNMQMDLLYFINNGLQNLFFGYGGARYIFNHWCKGDIYFDHTGFNRIPDIEKE